MTKDFIPACVLAFTPHADDVTLFAGGTLALWSSRGCRVHVVRVTNDEKDSTRPDIPGAIERNRAEFEGAMSILGVAGVSHLGFRDCELMDVPYGVLRESFIRKIREIRPEVIVSFDPAENDDENPDHHVVARAVADASWAAGYPNFHPEHAGQGLEPHVPLGNFYFTRHFVRGEHVVDIASFLDTKIEAALCHENMLCTLMNDQRRRLKAAGFDFPYLMGRPDSEYAEYWRMVVGASAQLAALGTDLEFAERFRHTLITEDDALVQLLSGACSPAD
ncbi:MAG TPA: PIG-L family deacetylase [Myxococcota bacterium]|nr:PIG-L family deacetylase [Myxococcota bacterium]HOC99707.1 PIG-L family deacetylase [Myxococcota bacterium]HOH76038.1 PIG-L family deacetylase [Myxococcota bacterium]HPV03932.1 PIG-L family deacetylase [Myxococcota bacterium]